MNVRFTLLVLIGMAFMGARAQVGINKTGAVPNASAMLDVSSDNQGVLVLRMTKDQKRLIAAPAVGLLVYQNGPDSVGFHYYSGTTWVWLGNSSAGWSITGNAGTDSAVHFLGTTDNKPLMLRLNNKRAGQLNAATHNNYIGFLSGVSNTTGTYNTAFGDSAQANAVSVSNSTAIGAGAMANKKEGVSAVAVGTYSLQSDSSANGNTGVGTSSLRYNKRSYENTAIGFLAGSNITGDTTAGYNTYIGAEAGYGVLGSSTGTRNVGIGYTSMYNTTSGRYNVGVGTESLYGNKTGIQNVAIGEQSLYGGDAHIQNTAIGSYAMRFTKKSTGNVAIGIAAMENGDTTNENVAIGFLAMNNFGSSKFTTAIGSSVLRNKVSGNYSVGVGFQALLGETNGNSNVGVGAGALLNNTSSQESVAVGYAAGLNFNGITNISSGNTYIGAYAGAGPVGNNSGVYNTATGAGALSQITTGNNNTAAGYNALAANTIGSNNTAPGYNALLRNTAGAGNIALGETALQNTTTGNSNIAIGRNAGNSVSSGANNSFFGVESNAAASIINATAIGYRSYVAQSNSLVLGGINGVNGATASTYVGIGTTTPDSILSVAGNFQVGSSGTVQYSNSNSTMMRMYTSGTSNPSKMIVGYSTQYPNTGLQYQDDVDYFNFLNGGTKVATIDIGSRRVGINMEPLQPSLTGGTLQVKNLNGNEDILGLYNAATGNRWTYWVNSVANDLALYYNGTIRGSWSSVTGVYSSTSDRRLKKDIQPIGNVLAAINKIPSYRFHYNDNKATDELNVGFMAQEVQPFFPEAVSTIVNKDGSTNLGIKYQYMSVYAIKAIQEQQQLIDAQQKQIEKLEQRMERLEKLVQK